MAEFDSYFDLYTSAMEDRRKGNLITAAEKLGWICSQGSIGTGHYAELFKIWRLFNKEDLKVNNYSAILKRIENMIALDERMIRLMLKHWGGVHNTKYPNNYFDGYRNLKISDVKTLLKAATALNRGDLIKKAQELIQAFNEAKSKK
jgi:hypothetical protein